jgi:hypothetical protein
MITATVVGSLGVGALIAFVIVFLVLFVVERRSLRAEPERARRPSRPSTPVDAHVDEAGELQASPSADAGGG